MILGFFNMEKCGLHCKPKCLKGEKGRDGKREKEKGIKEREKKHMP